MLRAIFSFQYSVLVFGIRFPRLHECPCQKRTVNKNDLATRPEDNVRFAWEVLPV